MLPRVAGTHAAAGQPQLRPVLAGVGAGLAGRLRPRHREASYALLLHGGVRPVQAGRRDPRVRGGAAVLGGRAAPRDRGPRQDQALRPRGHLPGGVHHHRLPERLLLHRQHRGGQGEDEEVRRADPATVRGALQPLHAERRGAEQRAEDRGPRLGAARGPLHRQQRHQKDTRRGRLGRRARPGQHAREGHPGRQQRGGRGRPRRRGRGQRRGWHREVGEVSEASATASPRVIYSIRKRYIS
ncbi:hypothetical protein FOCC_FOCC016196 [Frankliniella occidentalis]|nr:hypothetical protein FOCC_FOCC016196 [Frankliniella occidentalis]